MRSVGAVLRLIVAVLLLGGLLAGTVVALAPMAGDVREAQDAEAPEIDLDQLDSYAVRSYVYAAEGSVIATLHGPENRQPVELDEVPDEVVEAILAVEDADFYHHGGINVRAAARALVENVSEGGIMQGGSTITQQLVKNALLNDEQELDRKTREAAMALELERQMDKDEILESYLNTVYFGEGAYGVQAAAETYWGRSVGELGWAEGAMLAALIAHPSRYDPIANPEAAQSQRRLALDRLVSVEAIDADQAAELAEEPLPTTRCIAGDEAAEATCGPERVMPPPEDYFVEDVKQELLNNPLYGLGDTPEERFASVFHGGLRVHTTLDPGAQGAAEAAIAETVPPNDLGVTGALLALENGTGAVRAMVGGPGYETYRYNIATHEPGRQTGSSFKTLVLLTALEQGAVPGDRIEGGGSFPNPPEAPYEIDGPGGTLASITSQSSNGAFVRLGQIVGLHNVRDMAHRLGVPMPGGHLPVSMPLGTLDTTPLRMAEAYSAIVNDGVRERAYLIERIEDRSGRVLYEHEPSGTRAMTRQTACMATAALRGVVEGGTGTGANIGSQPVAGKTGTTDEHADAWFIGFSPYITTATWVGDPDGNQALPSLGGLQNFGGNYPATAWNSFNAAYHAGRDDLPLPQCEEPREGRRLTGPNQANELDVKSPLERLAEFGRDRDEPRRRPFTRPAPQPSPQPAPPPPEQPPPPPPADAVGQPQAGPPGQ